MAMQHAGNDIGSGVRRPVVGRESPHRFLFGRSPPGFDGGARECSVICKWVSGQPAGRTGVAGFVLFEM